ncbi:death effector domain-containing 1 [Brachionichthys hirsutus]|uniref:death effector domain-containing 1 n=1 Tax=Brachionichthys hirsutus TaxID=412623 RepID=UPI0036044124
MAAVHHPRCPVRGSLDWEETEALSYYGMLSLHEVFDIVGCQLTAADVEVLSFLLNETCPATHPLDPTGWTVEPRDGDPDHPGVSPSPKLTNAWRRLKPQSSQVPLVASCKPTSGLQLLLELEKQGYVSDGNLEPLLQLLRILTRHDLLPFVSHKKRRRVSPERIWDRAGRENMGLVNSSAMQHNCRQTETRLPAFAQQMRNGVCPSEPETSTRRRRKKRGNGWSRKPRKTNAGQLLPPLPPPHKVSCNVRLRVRAEYLDYESVLRGSVSSDKRQPLERQFELFSKANSLLRARDLGSIVCDIKFTELGNLEAFWSDYLSGSLLEALKGVFITDSLRMAAGTAGVRLLIGVDQDDYEQGRLVLCAYSGRRRMPSSAGCHRETH